MYRPTFRPVLRFMPWIRMISSSRVGTWKDVATLREAAGESRLPVGPSSFIDAQCSDLVQIEIESIMVTVLTHPARKPAGHIGHRIQVEVV